MNNTTFDEKELERMFAGRRERKHTKIGKIFLGLLSFSTLYAVIFFSINYAGLSSNFRYWYKTEYKNDSYNDLSSQDKIVQNLNPNTVKTISDTSLSQIPDNHLKIGLINVLAPISWRVPNNSAEVEKSLAQGLIQIDGTALPGEKGNVFITGHSSDYPWSKGSYKTVFVLLNKLSIGDAIQLKYQNRDFLYQVSEIKTVSPNDVSVLSNLDRSTLTLMTCTPVGTTLKRLIVIADQIYPNPAKNTAQKGGGLSDKSLPKPR